jgi:hypothetical protein
MLRVRNIAQRTCASRSFSEKYQCPDAGALKLLISPSTHSVGRPASSSIRASRFRRPTL